MQTCSRFQIIKQKGKRPFPRVYVDTHEKCEHSSWQNMIKVSVGKLTKLYGQNSELLLDISNIINLFMHNVWPFYNIMHERVKEKNGNQLGLYFVKKKIRGMS